MLIGTYVDGRPLTYNESDGSFAVAGVSVTPGQVRAYGQAGHLDWATPAIATWFATSFPAPVRATPPRKGRPMMVWGVVLLVVGVLIGAFGLMLNTSVYTPLGYVSNISLVQQQNMTLGLAAIVVLLGGVFMALGSRREGVAAADSRKCPQCAEYVMRDAQVCRYCGFDLRGVHAEEAAEQSRRTVTRAAEIAAIEASQRTDSPAGWMPDPAGRYQSRYWNGTSWTNRVLDRGLVTTDPLPVVSSRS